MVFTHLETVFGQWPCFVIYVVCACPLLELEYVTDNIKAKETVIVLLCLLLDMWARIYGDKKEREKMEKIKRPRKRSKPCHVVHKAAIISYGTLTL